MPSGLRIDCLLLLLLPLLLMLQFQVDFIPTYAAELAFWPLVQTANFSYVPVRHQLLAVNTFSLLDAAFISWVGNQQDWLGKIMGRLGLQDAAQAEGADVQSKQQ
jgi:hypothetical protein